MPIDAFPSAETLRCRVAVLGGGRSCEHDVSLASAASVADGLEAAGHDVVRFTIGADGEWSRASVPLTRDAAVAALTECDVVFPALHGPHGEDGAAAAWCDLAGVPFVGSGLGAGALAMDKWATKLVAEAVGVAVAPGRLVHRDAWDGGRAASAWADSIGAAGALGGVRLPAVVKPVAAGSSRGVSLVATASDLSLALAEAFRYDARALIEDVVVGREIDVAVLRLPDGSWIVSPPLEIADDRFFDYDTKYGGDARFTVPAQVTAAERDALRRNAITVADALGCDGVARVDFFLTPERPILNEVNTMPGMTAHSQVPRMFAADGLDYPDLLGLLVARALTRADAPLAVAR